MAKEKGFQAGAATGVFSAAGVAALTKFSPGFRKATSVSAKTALAISPIFLAYLIRTELVMHGANIDPQAYGIVDSDGDKTKGGVLNRGELSVTKKAANWCYQNPFKMMVGMAAPAVGGILYSMRNETNLKLSQKLMHTRVYGQMTVVSMMVGMMTFQEIMRRNGGLFVIAEPEAEEGEEEEDGSLVVARPASSSA